MVVRVFAGSLQCLVLVATPVEERHEELAEERIGHRVLHPDIAKEGATLKFLNENHVRHIPTVECHGDLGQSTVSQEHRLARGIYLSADVCPMQRLEHYRLVVKEVGMPLESFKSAYDLLIALTCCLRGAYLGYSGYAVELMYYIT